MHSSLTRTAWAIALLGCTNPPGATVDSSSAPIGIGADEQPTLLDQGASARLSDVITAAEVGRTFGVDDNHIPYPDTYWPFVKDGIDDRWHDEASPLEKYMVVTDPGHVEAAQKWEKLNHGRQLADVESWWGHCPGWTAAAISNAPVLHAVHVKFDGAGEAGSCQPGSPGCVKFEIGDINALMAEVYVDAPSRFLGSRCDVKPADIVRYPSGRVRTSGCKGLNAGSLLIVLADLLKRQQRAIAIDAQTAWSTEQIWNQPAYRYQVYGYQPISSQEEAAHLVSGGVDNRYFWNNNAKGFVRVQIGIKFVVEQGPNASVVSGASSTREMFIDAVLELDARADDPNATIIGGEYLNSDRGDRLTVPPFVWLPEGPGAEDLEVEMASSSSHNPFVKPSLVRRLVELGHVAELDEASDPVAVEDNGEESG